MKKNTFSEFGIDLEIFLAREYILRMDLDLDN